MTVQQMINESKKVNDKSAPVYFDCPDCGKVLTLSRVGYYVVLNDERSTEPRSDTK